MWLTRNHLDVVRTRNPPSVSWAATAGAMQINRTKQTDALLKNIAAIRSMIVFP